MGVALATFKNGTLDVIGTLINLRKEVGSGVISLDQFQRATKALGIRGERALTVDADALQKMRDTLASPVVNGAALQGATTMLQSFNEQLGILGQKWDVFKEKGGTQLLQPFITLAHGLGAAISAMSSFAQAHPQLTKFLVLTSAIAAGLLIVVDGVVAVIGGLVALGAAIGIPAGVIAVIGLIIAAIAALSAAIITWGRGIESFFTMMIPEAFEWGVNLLKTFAKGIARARDVAGPCDGERRLEDAILFAILAGQGRPVAGSPSRANCRDHRAGDAADANVGGDPARRDGDSSRGAYDDG